MGQSFFINSPFVFKAIWAIISIWIDNKTLQKFHFESGSGLAVLSKYLDVTQLPVELGGQNKQPLVDGYGIWTKELTKSYTMGSFFLEDRTLEYKYYYTEDEIKNLESYKRLNSINNLKEDLPNLYIRQDKYKPQIKNVVISNF